MRNQQWAREDVSRAFERSGPPLAHLLEALRSVIEVRIARVRQRFARRGHVTHDVEDLTQDVLILLLEDKGRVLRSWDPSRGLSLSGFVGIVAERLTFEALRRGLAVTTSEVPTDHDALVELAPPVGPEAAKTCDRPVA